MNETDGHECNLGLGKTLTKQEQPYHTEHRREDKTDKTDKQTN